MWFHDSKSGSDAEIGRLPGFPSFEPLQTQTGKDRQFLFEGPLRLTFFNSHLNSTDGDTVVVKELFRPDLLIEVDAIAVTKD